MNVTPLTMKWEGENACYSIKLQLLSVTLLSNKIFSTALKMPLRAAWKMTKTGHHL